MKTTVSLFAFSECTSMLYGPKCNISCSEFCLNKICNQSTGHCIACVEGRTGFFCEKEVSSESQDFGKWCKTY